MALTDNLIGCWEMESGALTTDATGTITALTNNNSVTSVSGGKPGNAASFNGTSQTLSHASTSNLQFGSDFTIAAWLNTTDSSSATYIGIGKDESGQREFNLGIGFVNASQFYARVFVSTASKSLAASTFGNASANTYYFVVVTYTSATTTLAIGVNAGTMDTLNIGGAPDTSTSNFVIGGRSFTGAEAYWPGLIDQVGKWSRVLSGAEITSLYNSGNGLSYAAMQRGIFLPRQYFNRAVNRAAFY